MAPEQVSEVVQARYGRFAQAAGRTATSCCGKAAPSSCCAAEQGVYGEAELASVPELARNLSRGCGNPVGFANLQSGEAVVDLGCGGGIDVILAARKVGERGKVFGVDFTPQMIERAKEAVAQAGLHDRAIEFRQASLEHTTLPHSCADVLISNCVINLCADQAAVYREAFRILAPGGRLAISDIVLSEPIDAGLRDRFRSSWAGCMGGAIPEGDYWRALKDAGFTNVRIVARHPLAGAELQDMACCPGEGFTPPPARADLDRVQGKVTSVKFSARKPSAVAASERAGAATSARQATAGATGNARAGNMLLAGGILAGVGASSCRRFRMAGSWR